MSVSVARAPVGVVGEKDRYDNSARSVLDEASALRDADRIDALEGELLILARSDPYKLRQALEYSLGDKADEATLNRLQDEFLRGERNPALVRFVDAGTLGGGAFGAYSAEDGGTVFLDRRLLVDQKQLLSVFAEEYGHHLDAQLGGEDAAGDEGEIFSLSLLDGSLDSTTLQSLRTEDDQGFVAIDGHITAAEFHQALEGDEGATGEHKPSPPLVDSLDGVPAVPGTNPLDQFDE